MHQIDGGLQRDHGELDIIEAVIKAISPGLKLGDMLEIKTDLTLSKLKTILKGHYTEEDTSDLNQRLRTQYLRNRKNQLRTSCSER